MRADPRFEVDVVAIDRKLTGDNGYGGAEAVSAFFERLGIEHQVNSDLRNLRPDYIFVNYPWQRNYAPQYRPDKLAAISRIVYVPYFSLPLVQEPVDGVNPDSGFDPIAAHLYTQRMHQLASLVFVQDQFMRDAYALTERGNTHVHFVGSTKLDALIAELQSLPKHENGKTLLWAPHHSYSLHWLNFGNFAQVREEMLEWASEHPEFKIVLRPHPFMFGTMVDRGIMTAHELQNWMDWWNALPNTAIDITSSSAQAFAVADYLLTDGISYLAEWPVAVGKPAIFLENPKHWQFTALGELAASTSQKISMISELESAIVSMPERALEIMELRHKVLPTPGRVANRILEVVAADAVSGAGGQLPDLVDVAAIKSLPWELQANREPLSD